MARLDHPGVACQLHREMCDQVFGAPLRRSRSTALVRQRRVRNVS